MFEVLIVSLLVAVAAMHVAFKLAPKPAQQKFRVVMATGLNKIGLVLLAQRVATIPKAADKSCGSGCDGCGAEAVSGAAKNAEKEGASKVVHFHPRTR